MRLLEPGQNHAGIVRFDLGYSDACMAMAIAAPMKSAPHTSRIARPFSTLSHGLLRHYDSTPARASGCWSRK